MEDVISCNKKAFFLPRLITALGKRAGVLLFYADKVLSMDPSNHPLLVKSGSTYMSNRKRTARLAVARRPWIQMKRTPSQVHGSK